MLDSWAVLAWLLDEPAKPRVDDMVMRARRRELDLTISLVNAGEVFYGLVRRRGIAVAEEFWLDQTSDALPIALIPATADRVLEAARLKATYPISYADAFAVALSRELGAPLATGDPEIGKLAKQGVLTVDWLGR